VTGVSSSSVTSYCRSGMALGMHHKPVVMQVREVSKGRPGTARAAIDAPQNEILMSKRPVQC
jgi:hypothetical protein